MATKNGKNVAAAALVKRRWAKTTEAERKAVGQTLAKARWELAKGHRTVSGQTQKQAR